MNTNDNIEAYLDGQLKGDELNAFKAELKEDSNLASEVLLHQEINESITDDDVYYLRQKLSLLIAKSSKTFPLLKTISSIAAGAIIIFSVVNITSKTDPSKVFSDYYAPYQTDLSTRSADNTLQGLDFAFKLYADGEYETAFEVLNNYNKEHFNNAAATYYQGLCAFELNKNEVAIQNFTTVISEGDYAYALHAKWYLSMLYLKTEQKDKAKVILEDLAENPNFYAERSRKILKKHF